MVGNACLWGGLYPPSAFTETSKGHTQLQTFYNIRIVGEKIKTKLENRVEETVREVSEQDEDWFQHTHGLNVLKAKRTGSGEISGNILKWDCSSP